MKTILNYIKPKEMHKLPEHANNWLRRSLTKPFMRIANKIFFDNNKIVFDSFGGKGYFGNPRCIAEQLLENRKYKLVWIVKSENKQSVPIDIKTVKKNSWKELFELATAKIWIDDNRKTKTLIKSRTQYYIQTWHGGGPCLKKVEGDAIDELDSAYIAYAKKDSQLADFFVSGCKWRDHNYRNAFWYQGEILKYGTPTSDVLFQDRNIIAKRVRDSLKIRDKLNIALYAPTFRNDHSLDSYNINYVEVIQALEEKFSGEWCIVIRLHPVMSMVSNKITYTEKIINGSNYPQIEDILLSSKVLITDFSGCMFDAFLLDIIVFLFASDVNTYIHKERKLYFDLDKLPASFSEDNIELISAILAFDGEVYKHECSVFLEDIGYYDNGNATHMITNKIISLMDKNI